MKATKRLLCSIAALAASLIFCIGVCLAWFVLNEQVSGNGFQSGVRSTNIETFAVTAYKLTEGETDGKYVKGEKLNGNSVEMGSYGGLVHSTTALLLEITYSFNAVESKSYNAYAQCSGELRPVNKVEGADSFNCHLSDAVKIYGATVTGEDVSVVDGSEDGFFADKQTESGTETVKKDVKLNAQSISDGTGSVPISFYCIIDYFDLYVTELYARALEGGGTLSSSIVFEGDIEFCMEEAVA